MADKTRARPLRTGQDPRSAHQPQCDAEGNCIDQHGRILPDWPAMRAAEEEKRRADETAVTPRYNRRDL